MRNKLFVFFMLILFQYSFSQKSIDTSQENFVEALSYLNLFLNNKSWAKEDSGGFTYNNYAKSLSFKSLTEIKDSNNTSIEIDYVLNLKNVTSIKEVIHKTDSNNIIFFDINLKDEIFYTNYTKQNNDVIPNYKKATVNKVTIYFPKRMTSDDLENIRKAIRDIFSNIPIETKIL